MILIFAYISLFDLAYNKNILSLLEILYFFVVLGKPIVVCI